MEWKRKYKEDLTRLNGKVIPILTTDLSRERKEVGELKRAVAITEKGKHLVEQKAQIERERTASIEERVASVEESSSYRGKGSLGC